MEPDSFISWFPVCSGPRAQGKCLLRDSPTVSHSSFAALALSQGRGAQGTKEVSEGRTVGG